MSRQIYFYFSDVDQMEFAASLDARGDTVATMPPFSVQRIVPQPVLQVALWTPDRYLPLLLRTEDLNNMIFRERHVRGTYAIEAQESPVIEFDRSATQGDKILRGRLYYVPAHFDVHNLKVEKPADVSQWAKKIYKIVKGLCVERRDFTYVGRDAFEKERQGFKLVDSL